MVKNKLSPPRGSVALMQLNIMQKRGDKVFFQTDPFLMLW